MVLPTCPQRKFLFAHQADIKQIDPRAGLRLSLSHTRALLIHRFGSQMFATPLGELQMPRPKDFLLCLDHLEAAWWHSPVIPFEFH